MKNILLCGLGCAALSLLPLHAQVQVSEGTLSLPAYQEGPPNPNPAFDQFATTRFNYPYALRDNLTSRRAERAFRAVFLENEYLKCTVLPDVGGHIYTCIDKINHVPMFYENPTIKEAAIGMRGGWAAFGVEFNFPVSHNWTTVSPIDFAYGKESDGSASITVSNIDRVYGMQWTVHLVLHPGSTVLEQQVTLNNRSDVRHRFYWWSNAGVQVWDDTRICYPMRYSAAHGYADVDHWPVDSTGTDLSLVKNQIHGPVSRFVHASREPFMGIWNPKTNAGVAHWADYAELPAKKLWSWGVDADAMDWRKALSDNDSAYVEVQAGLFRNQETYAFLQPRQTIHFTEFWMPLRELGGLSRANLAGAVHLSRSGSTLTASLNVNSRMRGATVRLLDGEHVVRTTTADLAPEHTWTQQVAMPNAEHRYTFELRDREGKVVLSQTEGRYDWTPESEVSTGPQKVETIPAAPDRTEDDWVQTGHDDELNGRLLIAANDYREGLKLYPRSQALTISLGRLETALLDYGEASALLKTAQARDTPNPEIAYYLGLTYDGLNEKEHARAAYESAARVPLMRAAAELRLGELDARGGDLHGAERWLDDALHDAPDDLRAAEELTAIRRARGEAAPARELAEAWYARNPTSYFLAEELGRPQTAHLAAEPERVLNVASEYMRLGRYESALAVLSRGYPAVPSGQVEPGAVAPAANPMLGYYKAFCLQRLGRPYADVAAAASRMAVSYVFPSGAQTEEVLRVTVESNKADATAQALLGTLLFSVGRTEEAEAHWQRAHDLHGVLPGLDVSRGLSKLYNHMDAEGALADFRAGLTNDPSNETVYLGMDQALSLLGRPPSKFIAAMEQYPDKAGMRPELVYELLLHHAEAGDYAAAKDLLRNRFFPREEGGTNVRQVYIEVEVQRLRTLAEKGRCGPALDGMSQLGRPQTGMSFTQDGLEPMIAAARIQYEIGRIDLACKRSAEADVIFRRLAESKDGGDVTWAHAAAQMLPGYDAAAWRGRLTRALAASKAQAQSSSSARYSALVLERDLGNEAGSKEAYRGVFLTADQKLSYHLARSAMAGMGIN